MLDPDYDPDRAQKLINSSMSRHLSTRNISFASMHEFLSNLAHRQTDKQTSSGARARTYSSSFVGASEVNKQTDRRTDGHARRMKPLSLSRAAA